MMTHETLAGCHAGGAGLAPELELAVHAIGDAAVRDVLDRWGVAQGRAACIEHCELIDDTTCRGLRAATRRHLLGSALPPAGRCAGSETGVPDTPAPGAAAEGTHQSGLILDSRCCSPRMAIVRPNPEDSVIAATFVAAATNRMRTPSRGNRAIGEELAWACFGNEADSSRTHRAGERGRSHPRVQGLTRRISSRCRRP